jgi:hypothetical protein
VAPRAGEIWWHGAVHGRTAGTVPPPHPTGVESADTASAGGAARGAGSPARKAGYRARKAGYRARKAWHLARAAATPLVLALDL